MSRRANRVLWGQWRERLMALMNTAPQTGGKMGGGTVPWDVMRVPVDDAILYAGSTADVSGVAIAADGPVALHQDRVAGISAEGQVLWSVPLSAPPVRRGLALTGRHCIVSLTDGHIVCLGAVPKGG